MLCAPQYIGADIVDKKCTILIMYATKHYVFLAEFVLPSNTIHKQANYIEML